jgi:PAS domain S-box-containing protein
VKASLLRQGQLEEVYFDITYTPLREADGSINRIMVLAVEITQQVLARQAVEASEAQFRSLIEEAPVATAVYMGPDLVIAIANEPMIRFFGQGPNIVGKPIREVLKSESDRAALALLNQVFTSGKPYEVQGAPADLTIDGQVGTYYFNFSLKPLRRPTGEVYAIIQMAVEVTGQVIARQNLEESEARYRSLASELEQRVDERTQELRLANQDLIRSNDNLQQFAYVASHDLQEPLRKI